MPQKKQKPIHVLIADDQKDILAAASLLLKSESIKCTLCDSPVAVKDKVEQHDYDVLLLDMNFSRDTTSGGEGIGLIQYLDGKGCDAIVVAMTAWATVDIAVEAMKCGASDFITKPWDNECLLSIIRTQAALKRSLQTQCRLANENALLKAQNRKDVVAGSTVMLQLMETIARVAHSDARLLITGENGTGKSMIARHCHELSSRADGPFISVNMGGLPDNLFESEIFGHEKGAYTGAVEQRIGRYELADGGTLFLDEIANMGEKQQATLLRLLETGEFERVGSSRTRTADVRIICATNGDLPQKVRDGSFRSDLLYRINTVAIEMPPLRKRIDDIVPLANDFLAKHKVRYNRCELGFDLDCDDALKAYSWPGNVRELDQSIERAVLLSPSNIVSPSSFGLTSAPDLPADDFLSMTLEQAEVNLLEHAIAKHAKQPDMAAKDLGVSRSALYRKLKKYAIEP